MNFSSWYEKVHPSLSGYGLWLHGNEPNTIPPGEWDSRSFRVLITRLSTWRDTADSFTHKLLHQIIGRIEGAYPDLAWLPPPKDADVFDRVSTPWLLGTTSKRPGRDFSVVALSLSIVQELLNIAPMLRKSGIPLSKRERMNDATCPLVILGGASALYTSALFGDDSPVDGIFIGTDALVIKTLFEKCKEGVDSNFTKTEILNSLLAVPGFILPDGTRKTKVFQAAELPTEQLLEAGPVLYSEGCIGTASLQISEGCACSCSFCAESFSRKPYREFGVEQVLSAALRLKAGMGAENIELYSFNFAMHRDMYEILTGLAPLFPSIGLKSQRLDSIARDPKMLSYLHVLGKTSLTCSIEGISPRLRRYLRKGLDEDAIRRGFAALLAAPLRELKIFLIATGFETPTDYDEFYALLNFMRHTMQSTGRYPRIIFSMTILVRFPCTPLEFEDAPSEEVCRAVLHTTGRLLQAAGFEFRAPAGTAEYWLSQLLVRAADQRIRQAVQAAAEANRFIYYEGVPETLVASVKQELERVGLTSEQFFAGYSPASRGEKPWSGIDTGVAETSLVKQWTMARKGLDGARAEQIDRTESDDADRPLPIEKALLSIDQFRTLLADSRSREVVLHFRVGIRTALAGVPSPMRGVVLGRALLIADPNLAPGYRGFRGSCASRCFGSNRVIGEDIVSLGWDRSIVDTLRKHMGNPEFLEKSNKILGNAATLEGAALSDQAVPVKVTFRSPFTFDLSAYGRAKAIKFTLCKTGPTSREYRISRESLKKKIILACKVERQTDQTEIVTLTPGSKFNVDEFARTAFALPKENEWVRIEIAALFNMVT